MKIFNRAESDPPENARRSKAVGIILTCARCVRNGVPITIIVSRKIVASGITNRFPRYPSQVNISSLLEVIAMAVSNMCVLISIKRFCIAGVQELCQSNQIRLRSNQPRVLLCTCSAAERWCLLCKRCHWDKCHHKAQRKQKAKNFFLHFHSSYVFKSSKIVAAVSVPIK